MRRSIEMQNTENVTVLKNHVKNMYKKHEKLSSSSIQELNECII